MEAPKEEPSTFLDRSSRSTRGKRMHKLLDDEIEEDEQFWNQEALKEEEDDNEYEEEAEVADEYDSDFDDDEPEADEEAENNVVERPQPKKKLIIPGRKPVKKKKKKNLSKIEKDSKDEKSPEPSTPGKQVDTLDDVEGERIVRKSTRTSVIVRQAERDAIKAALQATMKPIKRKKEGEEKKMSQEEMLLEAAQTEIMNLRNLERVLAREEEVKKRAVIQKDEYMGPQIRYASKNGYSYLIFSQGASFESEIPTKALPYPEKAVCAVTGLPAKYQDPKTGLPYATKEAFKIICERCGAVDQHLCSNSEFALVLRGKSSSLQNFLVLSCSHSTESNDSRRRDNGSLFDSIIGQGFLRKKKRTAVPNHCRTRDVGQFARFRLKSSSDIQQLSD